MYGGILFRCQAFYSVCVFKYVSVNVGQSLIRCLTKTTDSDHRSKKQPFLRQVNLFANMTPESIVSTTKVISDSPYQLDKAQVSAIPAFT